MTSPRLALPRLLAFAGIGLPATLLVAPIYAVLPSFYVLHCKADLSSIAAVLLLARIIDAVLDPVLGVLSDRTRSRLGPRLPWIIAGGALALPATWFLFMPPPDAGASYFFATSTALFIAWTMISIPHNAWAAELSDDYNERSRIFGVKNVLATVGGFLFFLIPPAIAPLTGTTEITMTTMQVMVGLVFLLLPLATGLMVRYVPVRQEPVATGGAPTAGVMTSVLRSLTGNRPFLMFILSTLLIGIATGMSTSLVYLYMEQMQLGGWFFLTSVVSGIAGLLSVPLWVALCARVGKHRPWALSVIVSGMIGLLVFLLPPGPGAMWPVMAIFLAAGVLNGVTVAIPSSILADVADYERLRSGQNVTGNYFSMLVLFSKINAALGGALGFWVASGLGYQPGQPGVALGFLVAFAGIPAMLNILAGLMLLRFPIDRARQSTIARALARRARRNRSAPDDDILDPATLTATVERLRQETGLTGVSAAVWRGGRQVHVVSGLLTAGADAPVRPDSLFQIGSVTKAMTATLVMQAVADGLIDLDRPVADYLGVAVGATPEAASVTVRQLLNHTSGLDGDLFEDTGDGDDCLARYADLASKLDLLCPPGRHYNYCNAGYALLGRLVEVARGGCYDRILKERLLGPIGAVQSTSLPEDLPQRSLATGHFAGSDGKAHPAPATKLPRSLGPAGLTVWSNAGDLVRFAALHMGAVADQILSAPTAAAMRRPEIELPDGSAWGAGWKLVRRDGVDFVGHEGGTIGQTAFLWFSPAHDFAVALCANGGAKEMYRRFAWPLFQRVCGAVPGIAMPDPAAAGRPLADYAGSYANLGVTMEVSEQDDHLRCTAKVHHFGQPDTTFDLIPVGGDRFRTTIGEDDQVVTAFHGGNAEGRPDLFYAGRLHRRAGG